jgi:glucose-6-phosphate isomerase
MSLSPFLRCDQTQAWKDLTAHFQDSASQQDLRVDFVQDPQRAVRLSFEAPHVFADLSKNLWNDTTRALLLDMARECGLERQRQAMLEGQPINSTENRSVGHVWLRDPLPEQNHPIAARRIASLSRIIAQREACLDFAETVRGNERIRHVVNIGIGGSDLGGQMVCQALGPHSHPRLTFHFVSNVDGHELQRVLQLCSPGSTLFLVSSKTFTSAETMANALAARQWFLEHGGVSVAEHFVALTTREDLARDFGIETCFGFWDWVGGRFSVWGAVGLPVAIALGREQFLQFLGGAHAMDRHFIDTPLQDNLPVQLALLDIWYRDFHRFPVRCITPYQSLLQRLPAWLQQLEMESNGKGVDKWGQTLSVPTSAVVFGEPGTNSQHAYFQMLHQGPDVIPVEFIACQHSSQNWSGHQRQLLANALAQAQALMLGRDDPAPHKRSPGNRPSTFLLLQQLDPASLGALLALYEHRTFVAGALWGINSFDQWGVELGKALAQDIQNRWSNVETAGLDASTAQLLRRIGGPS